MHDNGSAKVSLLGVMWCRDRAHAVGEGAAAGAGLVSSIWTCGSRHVVHAMFKSKLRALLPAGAPTLICTHAGTGAKSNAGSGQESQRCMPAVVFPLLGSSYQ